MATVIVFIAAAGFIKFNFLDVPYLGEPAAYLTDTGENVTTQLKVDDSIEISGLYFKTFHLKPSVSASDERYADQDESFVFRRKNDTMFIQQDGRITFRGTITPPPHAE